MGYEIIVVALTSRDSGSQIMQLSNLHAGGDILIVVLSTEYAFAAPFDILVLAVAKYHILILCKVPFTNLIRLQLPDSFIIFVSTVQESKLYGSHFKEITVDAPKSTKITFTNSDDED